MIVLSVLFIFIFVSTIYYSIEKTNGNVIITAIIYTIEWLLICLITSMGKLIFDIFSVLFYGANFFIGGLLISLIMKKMWLASKSKTLIYFCGIFLVLIIQAVIFFIFFIISFSIFSPM
ncbi:MAG: hypothetical protein IKF52_05940 [Clostridia bacterium]|nr:hypothetical protein [Clostridia bacterium]